MSTSSSKFKFKRLSVTAMALVTLAGCTSVQEVRGPSGQRIVVASCPGSANTVADCLNAIADKCGPSGYQVLNNAQHRGMGSTQYVDAYTGQAYGNSFETIDREVTAVCRPDVSGVAAAMAQQAYAQSQAKLKNTVSDEAIGKMSDAEQGGAVAMGEAQQ